MDARVFAALAEPNRLRIVELLDQAPRSVGEVATGIGLRQPQATKHLQTLENARLVVAYRLGRRRIYALRREPFQQLSERLGEYAAVHPSEDVLDAYSQAIADEQAAARRDPQWASGRRLRFTRKVRAPVADVWSHWTSAPLIRRWWSPDHFHVAECRFDPRVGGRIRIVMQEADGARYVSAGHVLALTPPTHLRFELAQLAADGTPLLSADHALRLAERGAETTLALTIRVKSVQPAAAAALAGMRFGWEQLLAKLDQSLRLGLVTRGLDDRANPAPARSP